MLMLVQSGVICVAFLTGHCSASQVVPLGVPGVDPANKVGKYVRPKEWNELISDPNTVRIILSIL
jgi:hypothetical protein